MYRTALRTAGPSALRAARPTLASGSRRYVSTVPPPPPKRKRGTWKGTFLRWGLAGGAVYFYNTSPIFADEEASHVGPAPPHFSDADLPTVDALIQEKRRQAAAAIPPPKKEPKPKAIEGKPEEADKTLGSVEGKDEEKSGKSGPTDAATVGAGALEPGSPEALEHEARHQGAFDPETGEINWDCPCLGGMADGPCGEEFKAAFSCFVYSKEEPKGMDCIDKFQHMQDCFRKYPDIYGAELADDDEEAGASDAPTKDVIKDADAEKEVAPPAKGGAEVIPKEAVDATDANKEKKKGGQ
ncbi:uncharacterized protein C8A04DRAFT_30201 [Dichotomopilus funicola]|uniref:Mitochondrial intermembrane space import and assembly protein 40 n=1 Tax=Dichotomopilus funicola TaxID=1934379 RepID=A0AAN6V0N0_9PEZI|nr:hypothetical protein C8A04DRAFT_30201 [Dichotomopilus funicola]